MTFFWLIIFILPALLFSWLAHSDYIPRTPGIILTIIGLIIFAGSVAISSLYLWYFASKIIHQRLDRKPITPFLENDKVFKFLQPYLIKFNLYNPASSQQGKHYTKP